MWDGLRVAEGDGRAGRDFFVSYTQADRAWAEWIAWLLEEDGHSVLIQAWDFVAGDNWVQRMRDGVAGSKRTIAVLSPDYLESEYGTAEWEAAWAADPLGAKHKLLPVMVRETEWPDLLGQVVGVKLYGVPEAQARARLRTMVAGALTGRVKPAYGAVPRRGRVIPDEPLFPAALPQVWKVPARNPNFTGRGAELAALAAALAGGPTVTVQAVRGMGGVGKTQLATQYAWDHAADYDLVYWLAAEEPAALPDQFTALAAALGLEPAGDPEGLQAQVHQALRQVPGWLLIFDNADDDADVIAPWIPAVPVAAGTRAHAVITTRRGGFEELGAVVDLDVVSPEEALALLRTKVPDLPDDTGAELAAELGLLPLALEQAAAYIRRTGKPPAEYLRQLRERAGDMYKRGKVAGRDVTIATLWDISLEHVRRDSPAAAQLLDLCAYLAPDRIPLDLFTGHPDLLPQPLATAAADELAFDEAVAVLSDYSLVSRTEAGLQVHRLLQGALRTRHRHQLSPDEA